MYSRFLTLLAVACVLASGLALAENAPATDNPQSAKDKRPTGPDIFLAAEKGDIQCIQNFLDEGGYPSARPPKGATMLYRAVKANNVDAVQFLLAHRANPTRGCEVSQNNEPSEPLNWIEWQKKQRTESAPQWDPVETLLKNACNAMQQREDQIKEALAKNDADTIRTVLKAGCVSFETMRKCIEFSLKVDNFPMFVELINYPEVVLVFQGEKPLDKMNFSPETKKKYSDAINETLNPDAYMMFKYIYGPLFKPHNFNDLDPNGKTSLMAAASRGNLKLVQYLLEQGADPNLKDYSDKTALDYVCEEYVTPQKAEIEALLRATQLPTPKPKNP